MTNLSDGSEFADVIEIMKRRPKNKEEGDAMTRDWSALPREHVEAYHRWSFEKGLVEPGTTRQARLGYDALRSWEPEVFTCAYDALGPAEQRRYCEWVMAVRQGVYIHGIHAVLTTLDDKQGKRVPQLFAMTVAAVNY